MPHSVDHARAWHDAGFEVVTVVIVDSLTSPIDTEPLNFANAVLLRVNRGYDFGAWAATILRLGRSVRRYSLLVTVNDSVLGPSNGFAQMLERVDRVDADLIGLVESHENMHHFQSFILFFKPSALRSRIFREFWYSVRTGSRDYVIEHYERELRAKFVVAGMRAEVVYPLTCLATFNPTLGAWRDLLDLGFPYLKVQLLRANPLKVPLDDWLTFADKHGFNTARLSHHIAELQRQDHMRWASDSEVLTTSSYGSN
jgi:lipopolysaccharide biosynthesis protein